MKRRHGGFVAADACRASIRAMMELGIKKARGRAAERAWGFDLTVDYLVALCDEQGSRCALTGMPFRMAMVAGVRNPFQPSIDRIDITQGYVVGNVRLTTVIANVARAEFGDEPFLEMCRAAVRMHGGPRIEGLKLEVINQGDYIPCKHAAGTVSSPSCQAAVTMPPP
jgi:hypothetical protein